MRNLILTVLLSSLPLLIGGCEGDGDTGGETGTDTSGDTDTGEETILTFEITIPFEGVEITASGDPVACDGTKCLLTDEGPEWRWGISATYAGYVFVDKYVFVEDGVQYQYFGDEVLPSTTVSWPAGGCPDPAWTGTSWCLDENGDDAWTMSQYGMEIRGEYCERDDSESCDWLETSPSDVDGDGIKEVVLFGTSGSRNVSGSFTYSFDDGPYGYGRIENDGSMLYNYTVDWEGTVNETVLVKNGP